MSNRRVSFTAAASLFATLGVTSAARATVDYRCDPNDVAASCGAGYDCVPEYYNYVHYDGYLRNAERGDLIMRYPTGDLVSKVLGAMGQNRTHVGMLTSDHTVHHNTRNMDAVTQYVSSRYGGGHLSPGDIYIQPWVLYAGLTTDGVQSINSYDFYKTGSPKIFKGSRGRTNAMAAATRMEDFKAAAVRYSLYAYTDEQKAWQASYTSNMCSGTVFEASRYYYGGFQFDEWDVQTPDWRASTAWSVYGALYGAVRPMMDRYDVPWGVSLFMFTDTGKDAVAMGLSRQIVNTFAFNNAGGGWTSPTDAQETGAFASGWNATSGNDKYVGWGMSMSPDALVRKMGNGNTNWDPTEVAPDAVPDHYTYDTLYVCQQINPYGY